MSMQYLNVPVWRRFLVILPVLLKLLHLLFDLEFSEPLCCISQGLKYRKYSNN